MTRHYWACLSCGKGGEFAFPETKTDTSVPAKHKCPGPVLTTTSAPFAVRLTGAAA